VPHIAKKWIENVLPAVITAAAWVIVGGYMGKTRQSRGASPKRGRAPSFSHPAEVGDRKR